MRLQRERLPSVRPEHVARSGAGADGQPAAADFVERNINAYVRGVSARSWACRGGHAPAGATTERRPRFPLPAPHPQKLSIRPNSYSG